MAALFGVWLRCALGPCHRNQIMSVGVTIAMEACAEDKVRPVQIDVAVDRQCSAAHGDLWHQLLTNLVLACCCCFPPPQFLQVLPLLVGEIRDAQVLCSLLQVSSTVRRVLQQARGGCSLRHCTSQHTMLRFSSFCSWLPQHSGMLSSLSVDCRLVATREDRQVMGHMLQAALQASTARVPGEAAPPGLQLEAYSTICVGITPALLSAVARTRPQQVVLNVQPNKDELPAAAYAALGTLRSVRALSVSWTGRLDEQQAATPFQDLCAGIGQLNELTELTLSVAVWPLGLQLLPASLQQLSLGMHAAAGTAQQDLTHLTALTGLSILHLGISQEDSITPVRLPNGVSSLEVLEGSGVR